jgi:2-(3-amino-3-carboxypropyl)histidine synthase
VAIQLPEGLKMRAAEIADSLFGATGVPVVIIGDKCYGACDLYSYHEDIADGLIHFGHSPIPAISKDKKILFIEATVDVDVREGIERIAPNLPGRVGLLASVQYVNLLPKVKEVLEGLGKKVSIGKGDTRLCYAGQILGCNCTSAESVIDDVDGFLFIGEGDFHPLGAAFGVKKDIMVYNPLTYEMRSINEVRDRILRKRFAAIEIAKTGNSFLVIVSSKSGQRRDAVADKLMSDIRAAGKKVYKVMMEEVTPESLIPYGADVFVNTACPRLATDDSVRFGKPILTPPEAEVAIGIRKWEDYEFDQIRD